MLPMRVRALTLGLAGSALMYLAMTGAATAQSPAIAEGRELAQKLCSNCHGVEGAAAATTRTDVPSFRSIARGPRATPEALVVAIVLPHPEMPGVPLTRVEIQALVEYILSLKTAP